MSAAAVPQWEPQNRAGYARLRRGEPETKNPIKEPQWNYKRLIMRAGHMGAHLILGIMEEFDYQQNQKFNKDPFVELNVDEWSVILRRGCKTVEACLQQQVDRGLISRDPNRPGWYQAHPENFEKAPILMPPQIPGRPAKPKTASAPAPLDVAAYHQPAPEMNFQDHPPLAPREINFREPVLAPQEINFHGSPPPPQEINFRPQPVGRLVQIAPPQEINFQKPEVYFRPREIDGRKPETYCPWNWDCPRLPNGLASDKPLSLEAFKPEETAREKADVKVDDAGGPDLPPSPAFGFAKFWTEYPRKVNRKAAEHAWDRTVTPATVEKVLACLDRYLESRDVKDGVVRNPDKWLHLCRHDNWESDWPKSAPPKEKPDFVSNVTRVIEDNLRKTGKPW